MEVEIEKGRKKENKEKLKNKKRIEITPLIKHAQIKNHIFN